MILIDNETDSQLLLDDKSQDKSEFNIKHIKNEVDFERESLDIKNALEQSDTNSIN